MEISLCRRSPWGCPILWGSLNLYHMRSRAAAGPGKATQLSINPLFPNTDVGHLGRRASSHKDFLVMLYVTRQSGSKGRADVRGPENWDIVSRLSVPSRYVTKKRVNSLFPHRHRQPLPRPPALGHCYSYVAQHHIIIVGLKAMLRNSSQFSYKPLSLHQISSFPILQWVNQRGPHQVARKTSCS